MRHWSVVVFRQSGGRGTSVVNVWCQRCLGEGVLLWWSMSGVKDVLGKGCWCGGQCLVSKMSWGRGAAVVVNVWCLSNKLKLNDEKTKAMLVGSRQAINLTC